MISQRYSQMFSHLPQSKRATIYTIDGIKELFYTNKEIDEMTFELAIMDEIAELMHDDKPHHFQSEKFTSDHPRFNEIVNGSYSKVTEL